MAKHVARPTVLYAYQDFQQNEARNMRLQNLAADPAAPVDGLILYRTDTKKVRARIDGVWEDLATMSDVTAGGISSNIVDAKGDLIVATGDNTVARKGVGTNGHALFADSAQADGLSWRAIAQGDVTGLTAALAGKESAGAAAAAQAYAIQRSNHTGTQTASTISDFTTAARSAISVTDTSTLDLSYTSGAISGEVLDSPTVDGATPAQLRDRSTHTGTQAPSTIATAATQRVLGRGSSGAGAVEELTVTGGIEFSGTTLRTTAFTGDVTKSAGGTATTIANNAVTNAKAADMPATTLKGNASGSTADPADLTPAQVKTMLAIAANDVSFTPAQGIAATNVQAAITEAVTDLTALVNAITEGRAWKDPVRAATTANITLSGTQTIDGVALVAGDRVLVKNQTSAAANGIYVVASGAWSRAADADVADELNGATVIVLQGTDAQGDIYTQTATIATLGTTAQVWAKTGEGNTTYNAGPGLELVGNAFRIATSAAGNGLTGGGGSPLAVGQGTGLAVSATTVGIAPGGVSATELSTSVAGSGLTGGGGTALAVNVGHGLQVTGNAVRIATTAAGNGLTGGGGVALAVGAGTGITVDSTTVGITDGGVGTTQLANNAVTAAKVATSVAGNGLTGGGGAALAVGAGTGISVSATQVSIDTSVVARKASGTLGNGSATTFTLTHNLGTRAVAVSVYMNSGDYEEWDVDVKRPTVNTVEVTFTGYTPALNEFGWVVTG